MDTNVFEAHYQPLSDESPAWGRVAILPWDTDILGFPVVDYEVGDSRFVAETQGAFQDTFTDVVKIDQEPRPLTLKCHASFQILRFWTQVWAVIISTSVEITYGGKLIMHDEKTRQESLVWARGETYEWYKILGHFQVQSVIENGRTPSLLDLGSGDGLIAGELSKHFSRVVGLDASEAHIARAQQGFPHIEFHVSLIEDFNIIEKFDTVIAILLLEHVVDPVRVLRIAASYLKPGGRVIAQVPNALAISRRLGKMMGLLKDEYELTQWDLEIAGHRRCYGMSSLIADFTKAGLNVVATGGIVYKMLSAPQMDWLLKSSLWDSGEYGWGGTDKTKDWRWEFCRACYEFGRERPEDCTVIYACGTRE